MLYLSLLIIGNLLFTSFQICETVVCPSSYNSIFNGCYKMNNGTDLTWSEARQYCINDTNRLGINKTGFITHLVAFESATETKSLLFWMKAWGIRSHFWTDGVATSSRWNWSGQPITWYFNSTDQAINRNGSYYQILFNTVNETYNVVDSINTKLSSFICEYQDPCEKNNSCQNNAKCYLNVGRELCICATGFAGKICDEQIDECLSSPCQHGGKCIDGLNNYSCDCSDIFFHGQNCEIPNIDPTKNQRSAAFWSVFGIVCSLVTLLTLSDLPWDEIYTAIGCPWYRFKCCHNNNNDDDDDDNDDDEDLDAHTLNLNDSPVNENNLLKKQIIIPGTKAKGMNYRIMNTVWNPENLSNENSSNHQSNGYYALDQTRTPNDRLIQSFASVFITKQKEKKLEEKRIYAVDIGDQSEPALSTRNPTDTMISWTQQLQDRLKNKQNPPPSASSTKELIETHNNNDN